MMKETMKQLVDSVNQAELVLIGIGEELEEDFSSFQEQYQDVLKGMDQNDWRIPFLKSQYLSNQRENKYIDALDKLKNLVQEKNYFVITTCKDSYVHKVGLDEERIVTPCGTYEYMQCSNNCEGQIVSAKEHVLKICAQLDKNEESTYPVCESCGEPLCFNNIYAEAYNEQGYMEQWKTYTKWLQGTINRKVCIIELGVGLTYPTVIRWPFEKVAMYNLKASFYRIHESLYQLPDEISEKGVSLKMNALDFLTSL